MTNKSHEASGGIPQTLISHFCKYCTQWFHNTSRWLTHLQRHRQLIEPYWYTSRPTSKRKKKQPAANDTGVDKTRRFRPDIKQYNCSYCSLRFSKLSTLLEHEQEDLKTKPHVCTFCDKRFSHASRLRQHERMHTKEKPFKCRFCPKSFSVTANKRLHERAIHTKETPYSCRFCDKKFSDWSCKVKHEVDRHEKPIKEKRFGCIYCGKWWATLTQKRQHEKTHSKVKPFSCSICSKSFRVVQRKIRHEKAHSLIKEKLFDCSYCDKKLATQQGKVIHERTQHTKERPFSCEYCDKKFATSGQKRYHERGHRNERPHACSLCPKAFVTLGQKKVHELRHKNEKKFECSFSGCDKRFMMACERRAHEIIHTDKKPFSCKFCGKCFNSCSYRKKHERLHIEKFNACNSGDANMNACVSLQNTRVSLQNNAMQYPYRQPVLGSNVNILNLGQVCQSLHEGTNVTYLHTPSASGDIGIPVSNKQFISPGPVEVQKSDDVRFLFACNFAPVQFIPAFPNANS